MNCPHCHSALTTQLKRTTSLGYHTFYCRACLSSFNERTGTRFNFLEVPADIVFQVLICRLEDGNLVDSLLREHRDMESAQAFFEQALEVAQRPPQRVVTDGLASYPRAISEVLGEAVTHEPGSCLDNPIEQDHRGIKQRYYPMLGFGAFESAKRFCAAFEEVRQYLRPRTRMTEFVSLSVRRSVFVERVQALEVMFQAA